MANEGKLYGNELAVFVLRWMISGMFPTSKYQSKNE